MTVSSSSWSRFFRWHWLHSFFGLTVSLFLMFIFLTGTLAVFSTELDWLRYPPMRVAPQEDEKLAWGQIYDAAQAARPGWKIVRMERFDGARFADKVSARPPGREGLSDYLWINPYTGELQGQTRFWNIQ